jgi:Xaa-Pro dipeptidase
MLKPELSRQRQKRLLAVMKSRRLDAVVIGFPRHVYYFSAFYPASVHQAAFILTADSRSCLIAPNDPASTTAVDENLAYDAQWMATLRQEQPSVAAEKAIEWLNSKKIRRLGLDTSLVSFHVSRGAKAETEMVDDEIRQMRRRKDPDELELIKNAIAITEKMYSRAAEIIAPGIDEVEVFSELQRVAVIAAAEPLTDLLGNDFACGSIGGPPSAGRTAKKGEIYILDLGPSYRGYFADNCRSFVVNGDPTPIQQRAWDAVVSSLEVVEKLAKPGVHCRELVTAVNNNLESSIGRPLPHHLGHGAGLEPHEFPHLNLKWDDVLMADEIISVEPGAYGDDLAAGIRIEDQYLVTPTGLTNLLSYPRYFTRHR